jgi:hypothetical protein
MPPAICPTCGKTLDSAAGIGNPQLPNPGDVSICLYCANVAIFDIDDTLRTPTAAEQAELDRDTSIQKVRATVRQYAQEHGLTPTEGDTT